MRVKVGQWWHDAQFEPVAVEVTEAEQRLIAMLDRSVATHGRFGVFPSDITDVNARWLASGETSTSAPRCRGVLRGALNEIDKLKRIIAEHAQTPNVRAFSARRAIPKTERSIEALKSIMCKVVLLRDITDRDRVITSDLYVIAHTELEYQERRLAGLKCVPGLDEGVDDEPLNRVDNWTDCPDCKVPLIRKQTTTGCQWKCLECGRLLEPVRDEAS